MADATFPIQQPLMNRDDVQYAMNILKVCYTDYVKEGVQLVVTIDRKIEPKTKSQRGGCMLWFEDMAKAMGVTPAEARMFCMHRFFSPVIATVNGEELVSIRSFGDLNKDETSDLMSQMEVFCAEEGIPLRMLRKY